jgi:hypothetical protein
MVNGRFDDFCGGIAMMQANTATVDSNFSRLGSEKDEHQKYLPDLALEGIRQSKQFELLDDDEERLDWGFPKFNSFNFYFT